MEKTGTKRNSLKQQRLNAGLERIIENFGNAMRDADSSYITRLPCCRHDIGARFTLRMETEWNNYVHFLRSNPQ